MALGPLWCIANGEAEYRYLDIFKIDRAVLQAFRDEDERALLDSVFFVREHDGHVAAYDTGMFTIRRITDEADHLIEVVGVRLGGHGHIAIPYPDEINIESPRRYIAVQRDHMGRLGGRFWRWGLAFCRITRPVWRRLGDNISGVSLSGFIRRGWHESGSFYDGLTWWFHPFRSSPVAGNGRQRKEKYRSVYLPEGQWAVLHACRHMDQAAFRQEVCLVSQDNLHSGIQFTRMVGIGTDKTNNFVEIMNVRLFCRAGGCCPLP